MDKGKARADDAVIDVTLSDSDDNDFFTARRFVPKKAPNTPRKPTRLPSPPVVVGSDDDEEGGKKRKRSTTRKKDVVVLPEWTRRRQEERDRARAERERRRREPSATDTAAGGKDTVANGGDDSIVVISSDDDESRKKPRSQDKGKALARPRDDSPELTPPPEPEAEDRARMQAQLEAYLKDPLDDMYRVAERIQTSDDSADPDESSTTGPSVIISVRMVADEERKATASEKAVKHYETPRVVHMVLNDPLQKLAGAIAERLGKEVHDLVFVYKRRRIYALSQTPEELGMYGSAELVGYEKTYWDKIQREEAEARASLLAGGPGDDTEPPADIPSPELPDPSTDTIKIKLRGSAGEVAVSTKQVNSAVTLVRYYCSKFGLTYEGSGLCLILDGERVENNTTVEEMDLDDGDMVDVDTR